MLPLDTSDDLELIALALETRRVAEGVPDAAIRCRLLEIAKDVLRLARAPAPSPYPLPQGAGEKLMPLLPLLLRSSR